MKRKLAIVLAVALILGGLQANNVSAAKSPKLSQKKITVGVGNTKKIIIKNNWKSAKVTWKSKNTKVAKVTKSGKVTGVKAGQTKITVKVKKGNKKKTLVCKVTVKTTDSVVTTSSDSTASPMVATTAEPTANPQETTPVEMPPIDTPPTPTISVAPDDTSDDSLVEPSTIIYDNSWDNLDASDEVDALINMGDTSSVTGTDTSGVNITSKGNIKIVASGTYELTGNLTEHKIDIDTEGIQVHLILNNVTAVYSTEAVLQIAKTAKVVITLVGTNVLGDNGGAALSSDPEDDTDDTNDDTGETIIAKKDSAVTVNGVGNLTVNASRWNGIKSKGTLKITSGTVTVNNAVNNGIQAKTALGIAGGTVTVSEAGNDGIKSTEGYIDIVGGTITVISSHDGISAATTANIEPDTLAITTSSKTDYTANGDVSAKGIKAATTIVIGEDAGTLNINTKDDAIHSNGCVAVRGGNLTIATGDDGIHGDTALRMEAGTTLITQSYEGLESGDISIIGGNITLTASDDGINAAGGNDGSSGNDSFTPRPGGFGGGTTSTSDYKIMIYGGTMIINAQGDGIDANGSVYMYGGDVTVYGPTGNDNGALDYDNVFEISGGTLWAAGSNGMTQSPSAGSTQYALSLTTASSLSNATISIKDSSGNTIVERTMTKSFQNIVISTEEFNASETYSIYQGTTLLKAFTFTSTNMSVNLSSGSGFNPGPWH